MTITVCNGIKTSDWKLLIGKPMAINNHYKKQTTQQEREECYQWFEQHMDNLPKQLEMGFMSNYDEDMFLTSEDGQDQIVRGLVNGVDEYFSRYGKMEAAE